MRRVRTAGNIVQKERLVGRGRVQIVHVPYGVISHISREVVTRLADPWKHLGRIAKEVRRPLVAFTAHETVKVLEAHTDRPLVERPSDAVLKARRIVVLAEPRSGVTVVPQDRADGRVVRSDDGVIARITRGQLTNHAEAHRMMISPGDESGARG